MSDWQDEWRDVIVAVGTEFDTGEPRYGADPAEGSVIRRYLEPLEFDCPLHYDAEVARAHGYDDMIAPYTLALTCSIPAMWHPGDPPLFVDDDRDAQPARTPINNADFPLGPRTTGFFATDVEFDFVRPLRIGERVARRGHKLLSCTPKETSVGRGAFTTWESEIIDEAGDVVVRMRVGTYAYVPHESDQADGVVS